MTRYNRFFIQRMCHNDEPIQFFLEKNLLCTRHKEWPHKVCRQKAEDQDFIQYNPRAFSDTAVYGTYKTFTTVDCSLQISNDMMVIIIIDEILDSHCLASSIIIEVIVERYSYR